MNRDDSQQILQQNGLQQTCMLEAEMIHRDKYGAIQELFERGVPKKAIARALGIHVKTVRRHLKRGRWVPYQREPAVGKVLSGFEDWIKARAPEVDYNASVLFREARLQGYQGGYETLKRFVRPLRAEHRKLAEATMRFETLPGQSRGRSTGGQQRCVAWGAEGTAAFFHHDPGLFAPILCLCVLRREDGQLSGRA